MLFPTICIGHRTRSPYITVQNQCRELKVENQVADSMRRKRINTFRPAAPMHKEATFGPQRREDYFLRRTSEMRMRNAQDAGGATTKARAKPGKYLTFFLSNEEYGAEILKIREIIGLMDITVLPMTNSYVKGVINLRGKVIPVIDLRLKFGMPEVDYTKETCIIVVAVKDTMVGVVVDTVSEVVDINGGEIEPSPELGSDVNTEYILGIGKVKGETKILLDMDAVLDTDDMILDASDVDSLELEMAGVGAEAVV